MPLTRFLVCSDNHGDRIDKEAEAKFFAFDAIWKPQVRIHLGDLMDLRPLRRNASADERHESMRADIDAGQAFLKRWKPNYWLRGNHCERLWELAEKGKGVEADYAQQGIAEFEALCSRTKTKILPYHKRDGVLRIGHLKCIHGFHSGVYAARQSALIYGSVLMGHVHSIDEHSIPGLERRVARIIGCLCSLDMDYAARMPTTLRHAHGWAYGVVDEKTGNYQVWQAEKIADRWLLASEFVSL